MYCNYPINILQNSFTFLEKHEHSLTASTYENDETQPRQSNFDTGVNSDSIQDSSVASYPSDNELHANDISNNDLNDVHSESSLSDNDSFDDDDDSDRADDLQYVHTTRHDTGNASIKRFNTDSMDGDAIMFPAANLSVSDVMLMVTAYSESKNLSKRDQRDLIEMVKKFAGPEYREWSASNYKRAKVYDPPSDKITTHFFCVTCNTTIAKRYLKENHKYETAECNTCRSKYKLSTNSPNDFMSVDIKYQLQLILSDPNIQTSLLKNLENRNEKAAEVMSDIYDSELYKKITHVWPTILTLYMNVDGAAAFNSSSRSFVPQQLYINELPPKLRFKHIILGGVYVANKEPKPQLMNLYNGDLCNQISELTENGINILHHMSGKLINFKFTLCCVCVDTVARPICQNRIQFNGYFGCSWCYAHGKYAGRAMRYPLTESDSGIRTHEKYVNDATEAERVNSEKQQANVRKTKTQKLSKPIPKRPPININGVKGSVPFINILPLFDCLWGFPIDFLHGVLLGVTRQLWTRWTTPNTQYYLTNKDRKKIDERLTSIKPTHEIHRFTRSTTQCAKWKASEWGYWILFWSSICLKGILDIECFESYLLFVRSIHTLLQKNISAEDLQRCEYDLMKFVGECEIFYEETFMTFNVHSLLHLCKSVEQSGPLWATSTFPFENGIFRQKKNINGPNGVSHQISRKWLKKMLFLASLDASTDSEECKSFCLNLFENDQLVNCLKLPNGVALIGRGSRNPSVDCVIRNYLGNTCSSALIFDRCIYEGKILHSEEYTRATRTKDSFVLLCGGQIVRIEHIIVVGDKCYIYAYQLNTLPSGLSTNMELNYIRLIAKNNKNKALLVEIDEIKEKVVYINTENEAHVCFFPNIVDMN